MIRLFLPFLIPVARAHLYRFSDFDRLINTSISGSFDLVPNAQMPDLLIKLGGHI